jgi:hypothetical protein
LQPALKWRLSSATDLGMDVRVRKRYWLFAICAVRYSHFYLRGHLLQTRSQRFDLRLLARDVASNFSTLDAL